MTSQQSLPKPKRLKLLWVRRVVGDSMVPTLWPGSVVVGVRLRKIKPGQVVIIRHQGMEKIKRVKDTRPGEVFLTGDNVLHSTDSRDFGWLDKELVVARVLWPRKL